MTFWGANLARMTELATDLQHKSTQLSSDLRRLDKLVGKTGWKGPDADRFRAEWGSKFAPELRGISDDLDSAAKEVRRAAEAQQKASR